jgi:hypothetical protein
VACFNHQPMSPTLKNVAAENIWCFNAMIFRLTIVHGKYKAEAYDGLDIAELTFTSLKVTEKEVARSRPRKRGGVASENRSAVDTENAES